MVHALSSVFVLSSRFIINPECLASLLLCEKMQPNECIAIIGTERLAEYVSYMITV